MDFNLFKFYDRAGNFIRFKRTSKINFEVSSLNNKFLVLGTWMEPQFIPDKYIVSLETKSNNETLEKKVSLIKQRWTDFSLMEPFDYINLDIFCLESGQCVFSQKNISYFSDLTITASTMRHLGNYKNNKKLIPVTGWVNHQMTVKSDNSQQSIISQAKQERNQRLLGYLQKKINFTFEGNQNKEAQLHFYKQLSKISQESENKIVYLSDPYFLCGKLDENLYQLLFRTFMENPNVSYRILTHKILKNQNDKVIPTLKVIRSFEPRLSNIQIKQFPNNPYHDRWMCSDSAETGFSNSLNNFKRGVIFYPTANFFYKISENLWNQSVAEDIEL